MAKKKQKQEEDISKPLVLDNYGNVLEISHKQLMFCNYYLETNNAAQAAVMAGYSPASSTSIATRLMKNQHIRSYISARGKNILESIGIRQEQIARETAKIAFSNVIDLFDEGWDIKDPSEIPKYLQKAIKNAKVRTRTTVRGEITETTKEVEISMHDKLRALERLAEMAGMINKGEGGSTEVVNNNTYINQLGNFYLNKVKKDGDG